MRKKGTKPSFKKEDIESDWPLLKDVIDVLDAEEFRRLDTTIGRDTLKVIKMLLGGEISLEDYSLWLLELEKKHPNIKPTSFREASMLMRKAASFKKNDEHKGVRYAGPF